MATSAKSAAKKPKAITPLTKRKAWKALGIHYKKISKLHLRKLFADDPKRGERLTLEPRAFSSTTPSTASTTRPSTCCCNWPTSRVCASGLTRCSAGKK